MVESNPELKVYTEVQMIKLTQFDKCSSTIQFLRSKSMELSMGASYQFRTPYGDYSFDMDGYWMLAGVSSKLFNQLMDMGLQDEVKSMIERGLINQV